MADRISQIFHKQFTDSEITSGSTFNFTTDANTAYVIKDIQVAQNDSAPTKITATASIGLTADYNATPSKAMELGTIASNDVNGVTGSEIMDASSTLSIKVPATAINFKDVVYSIIGYNNNGSITEFEAVTPTVSGESEPALTPSKFTATNIGSNFAAYNYTNISNNKYHWRVFVTNPNTSAKIAIHYTGDGNSSQILNVAEFDGSTNYTSQSLSYKPSEFDGRFVFTLNNSGNMAFYDTKSDATRSLTNWPHGYVTFANAAGTNLGIPINPQTYPKFRMFYFSDVKKNYALIAHGYQQGLYLYEMPDYDSSPTALAQVGGNHVKTTGYWQLNAYNWSGVSNGGPSANRYNPARVNDYQAQSQILTSWHIGTSAASTRKRILFWQNGATTASSNRLYFFMADLDTLSQTQNNSSANEAWGISMAELSLEFGWDTSTGYVDYNNGAYIQVNQFQNITGSSAEWGTESTFTLDNDILTFTNVASRGTGEGPIVAWNLKTNKVTAVITWDEYKDSSNSNINNPASNDKLIGHRHYAETPSSTTIAARTYTKKPTLQVRATGIKEDRS